MGQLERLSIALAGDACTVLVLLVPVPVQYSYYKHCSVLVLSYSLSNRDESAHEQESRGYIDDSRDRCRLCAERRSGHLDHGDPADGCERQRVYKDPDRAECNQTGTRALAGRGKAKPPDSEADDRHDSAPEEHQGASPDAVHEVEGPDDADDEDDLDDDRAGERVGETGKLKEIRRVPCSGLSASASVREPVNMSRRHI